MGERFPLSVAFDATALGSGRGGDETLLRGMLVGLVEAAGDDARFPLFVRPHAPLPHAIAADSRFPQHILGRGSRALRYVFDLPRALTSLSPRPDLVYTQTHASPLSPVRSVLQLTDLSFHHHPELYPLLTRVRLNALVPLQARRAEAVLVISEFTRRDVLTTFGLAPERVFVVPCAVEHRQWPAEDPPTRAARLAELGIRQPYILFVGNLHPRKNPRRLIEAFTAARRVAPELASYQLVLAGTEHGFYPRLWQPGEAERMRQASGGMVVATGRVSDQMRDRLIAAAEVLAYPSLFEGFGLPPVEAMAAGTPVLAANTSAMPEVLGDAALLVDPYDVDAIARGLITLATRPELRAELRARGYRRAALYATRRCGDLALSAFAEAAARLALSRSGWFSSRSDDNHSLSMPGSSATSPTRRQTTASSLDSKLTATSVSSPDGARTQRATPGHNQRKARHTS